MDREGQASPPDHSFLQCLIQVPNIRYVSKITHPTAHLVKGDAIRGNSQADPGGEQEPEDPIEAGDQDQDQDQDQGQDQDQEETGLISLSKGRTVALLDTPVCPVGDNSNTEKVSAESLVCVKTQDPTHRLEKEEHPREMRNWEASSDAQNCWW
ncbi:hypothetical protein TURU_171147 [Turdus rufiventris]|nr:hypothetical protein TURU_171147 [Turdus rufiventris]